MLGWTKRGTVLTGDLRDEIFRSIPWAGAIAGTRRLLHDGTFVVKPRSAHGKRWSQRQIARTAIGHDALGQLVVAAVELDPDFGLGEELTDERLAHLMKEVGVGNEC